MKLTVEKVYRLVLLICLIIAIVSCDDKKETVEPGEDVYVVTTFAGNGLAGFENGTNLNAQFHSPNALTVDEAGNLYVADGYNHSIRKIDPSGEVRTISGNGESGYEDGRLDNARFTNPQGVAFDLTGNLLVAEKNQIRKISTAGLVSTLAGQRDSSGFENGSTETAQFHGIKGIVADHNGNIFVADQFNHVIRKIDQNFDVRTFAGNGLIGNENGLPEESKFNHPIDICIDQADMIYVADKQNNLIRSINKGGVVQIVAGSVYGYKDGALSEAKFKNPSGIAVDNDGNIIIADSQNFRIRLINKEGIVSTIAGDGVKGYANGNGLKARFGEIVDITVDHNGSIYLVDKTNHCIRKIEKNIN
ncbi:NHL repeat-containing protein [Fulvivirgaceae bacterium BMA10]|uniref:NHL repeat-containing protein n=1 Tax=Splendidivirga corallicola TaxID=3051826 RepID=A0ABT8KIL3_9BACT|nr:NHL repeat-containing protein [Fulvivirgaceae bacterium BMA10]